MVSSLWGLSVSVSFQTDEAAKSGRTLLGGKLRAVYSCYCPPLVLEKQNEGFRHVYNEYGIESLSFSHTHIIPYYSIFVFMIPKLNTTDCDFFPTVSNTSISVLPISNHLSEHNRMGNVGTQSQPGFERP